MQIRFPQLPIPQLTRFFQIVNVFATLFDTDRGRITDPTTLLPEGFLAKPNIRQGKIGYRSENEIIPNFMPPARVVLDLGVIEGYLMKVISGRQIYAFEGVPYAEAPTGDNRFRSPVPKKPWNGTLSAKSWGPMCMQTRPRIRGIFGNEDCLFLNIYTPDLPYKGNQPKLPIVIFIHGGAWGVGSSTEYGGSYLMEQDLVLVTINYRLGVFGFLSTVDTSCSGNWGLKDQAEAIEFIRTNAEKFGGDPSRLILMGQSAGAVSVHLHMMSNYTKDKIFAAISLSGTAFNPWSLRRPTEDRKLARRLATLNLCRSNLGSEKMIDCLRSRSATNITVTANILMVAERKVFMPILEPDWSDAFISKTPTELYELGEVVRVPFICTMTSRELEINLAFKLAGIEFIPLFGPPIVVLTPILLDYQGKVNNQAEVSRRIVDYYGGDENIRSDPEILAQMATDRHFSLGIRKAIKFHAEIAPTFSYFFTYRNDLGIASDLRLNPYEFGVPHGEDVIFMFNRTDRKPMRRTQNEFAIVKLLQNLIANFATTGEPLYTSDDFVDFRIWDKVAPEGPVRFLRIDKEVKMISIPEFDNATEFWESLNISDL